MKKYLVLTFIAILALAVSGCLFQPAPTPPPTKAILTGKVIVPQGAVRQVGGQALPGATVNVIDPVTGNIIATTTTDANGNYQVEVPPGGPYIIEAVKGNIKVLDVSPQVEVGQTYDLGTADATSTAVALVFQAKVEAGEDPAQINLDEILEDPKIGDLIEAVEEALAAGEDPTTAPEVTQVVEVIVTPPAPTPAPPSGPVTPTTPTPTASPTPTPTTISVTAVNISGDTVIGETLIATVTPSGATVTYQWQSATEEDGTYTDITDATKNKYELTEGDKGKWIKVKVTGTGIYTGTVTSNPVGPVARVFNITQRKGYEAISLAINEAIAGDTIIVGTGTYSTTGGETFPIIINKSLTLKGVQQKSIIDVGGMGAAAIQVNENVNGVTIDGFTIKNSQGRAAIIVGNPDSPHTSITTENVTISNNTLTTSKRGLAIYDNRNSLFENNYISDNTSFAIYIAAVESSTEIKDNRIIGNCTSISDSQGLGAITVSYGSTYPGTQPTITDNYISDNGRSGICIYGASAIIKDNTVTKHSSSGIWLYASPLNENVPIAIVEGNTVTENGGEDSSACGIRLAVAAPVVKGNTISDNNPCGIWLDYTHNPYYGGAGDIDAVIENNTIKNNVYGIYFYNQSGSSPTITGNTITGNSNDGILLDVPSGPGNVCHPTIHSNKISGNTSYGVENKDSSVTLDATCNWWGNPDGPSRDSVAAGDKVSANVDYEPWCEDESCSGCN